MGDIKRGTEIWAKTMPKSRAPCKNCTERRIGCHGECKAYREYCAFMEKVRETRKKIIEADYFPGSNKKL